jgi:predicted ATPase
MTHLNGYQINEVIHESDHSQIFRGIRDHDGAPVVITRLNTAKTSPSDIARFNSTISRFRSAGINGMTEVIDLFNVDRDIVLVNEWFEGKTLSDIMFGGNGLRMKEALGMALSLADTLGHVHESGLGGYLSLRPSHIFVSADMKNVKIAGYGPREIITGESGNMIDPRIIKNVLPYLSPEQTGRINRTVDYRSDLYSLGICFYEMLTGCPPFLSTDPMATIHSHIALSPKPLKDVRQDTPSVISDIVDKLLEKAPENRYQNAFGLHADLKKCLSFLNEKKTIPAFTLAENDIPRNFIIPQKLFGREKDVERLLNAYESARKTGRVTMAVVKGDPGIGKSSVILEIQKPVIGGNGFFISGKYEQFRNDKPYNAIIQAFQSMIRQILSQSEDTVGIWKNRFLEALGSNARIVTDIIPELGLVTGPVEEPEALGIEETKNRFSYIFEQFVQVFCAMGHPIVLFLDDIQWADHGSFKLLNSLVSGEALTRMFIILSYRENEVDAGHPLSDFLEESDKAGVQKETITLSPITGKNITELIVNFLKCPEERAGLLAVHLLKKTAGNPFFVIHALQDLYNDGIIVLDPLTGWVWDDEALESMKISDNVVDMMVEKIIHLPGGTQETLKICSCIGNRFNLESIAMVRGVSVEQALKDLETAVAQGLACLVQQNYVFHHDRIQEAAYSLLSPDEKSSIHHLIGTLELEKNTSGDLENKIFYIADQLSMGLAHIKNPAGKLKAADLFLAAGRKVKSSAAFSPAYRYLRTGLDLLPQNSWTVMYDFTRDFYIEAVEAAYLNGDYGEMDRLAGIAMSRIKTAEETVPLVTTRMSSYCAREDYLKAIDICLPVLKTLGMALPVHPGKLAILKEIIVTKSVFAGMDYNDFITLGSLSDTRVQAIMRLVTSLIVPAFFAKKKLYAVIILKAVRLSKRYGNSPELPFLYMAYATILGAGLFDLKNSRMFGELGMDLLKKYNERGMEAATKFAYFSLVKSWLSPFKDAVPALYETSTRALEAGNILYASFCRLMGDTFSFFTKTDLSSLLQKMEKSRTFYSRLSQYHIRTVSGLAIQHLSHLVAEGSDPKMLAGPYIDAESQIDGWAKTKNFSALSTYYFAKLSLAVMFHHYDDALRFSERYKTYIGSQQGVINYIFVTTFDSTARLMLYPKASFLEKIKHRFFVSLNQFRMKIWSNGSPSNASHHYALIEALSAWRLKNDFWGALTGFDKAIRLAGENSDIHIEHLCHDLAAEFCLEMGAAEKAAIYLEKTMNILSEWGAKNLILHLIERHKDTVITPRKQPGFMKGDPGPTLFSIDIKTVTKASLAISGEIDLKKLLDCIILLSMENAGAQKGFLIFENKDETGYRIEAAGMDGGIEDDITGMPVESGKYLAVTIVNFVFKTGEDVVIADAWKDSPFLSDTYIRENRPKSVLCSPIRSKGRVMGVIYLENNRISGAFTPDRIELLNILTLQAAVSIENARLFQDVKHAENQLRNLNLELEQRVQDRTRDLSEAYEEIMGSIRYSAIIQATLIPPQDFVHDFLPGSFFIWKPKNIVGGDFYVCEKVDGGVIIALIDCTGHGVPGALMTMLAGSGLRRIIHEERTIAPSAILHRLNHFIKKSLHQD